jgi:tetratricopeptide (TPR) repeat protein
MKLRWFVAWGAVVCLALFAGASWAESQADRLCTEGLKLQKAGKIQEALLLYNNALSVDLQHHTAMRAQAVALYQLGENRKAEGALRDLVALYPDDTKAQLLLARMELASGLVDQAKRRLVLITDKDPKNVSAIVGLGQAEYLAGNCYAGTDLLHKAMDLNPSNPRIRGIIRQHLRHGVQRCVAIRTDREAAERAAARAEWLRRFNEVYARLAKEEAAEDQEILKAARKELILSNIRRREALFDASLPRYHWHEGQIQHETEVVHTGTVDVNVRGNLRLRRGW